MSPTPMTERKATVTAEFEGDAINVTTLDGRHVVRRPSVLVTTTFEFGQHEQALAVLREAVADVERQIADVAQEVSA